MLPSDSCPRGGSQSVVPVVAATLLLLASAVTTRAQSPAPPAAAGAAIGAFVKAFNSHDAPSLAAIWADNAVYISDDGGMSAKGRPAIAQAYSKLFADDPKCRLTVQTGGERAIAPTVASVDGTADVTHSDGQATRSAFTAILSQKNGQWLIDQVHERDVPMAPAAAPQLAALDWLAGEWTGQVRQQQIVLDLHWAPNMGFITGSVEHLRDGSPVHEVSEVIGWDAEQHSLRTWQFSSDGGFAEGLWQPQDDNHWVNKLVAKFPDGRRGSLTHLLTRIANDQITLQTVDREVDGEPQPNSDPVTLTRRGATPGASGSTPDTAVKAPPPLTGATPKGAAQ